MNARSYNKNNKIVRCRFLRCRKSAKRFETQIPVDGNVYVSLDYFDRASTLSNAYNTISHFLDNITTFLTFPNAELRCRTAQNLGLGKYS